MIKTIELVLPPQEAANEQIIKNAIRKQFKKIPSDFIFRISKRSVDARSHNVKIRLVVNIYTPGTAMPGDFEKRRLQYVSSGKPVIVAGSGPAGLFAALRLIESGFKPIIIERGKDVRSRRRDLAVLNKQRIVNPESNYCFGQGGAGTYSDGKLYTRSTKRGNVYKILHTFIEFGASPEIAVDAHPHIGTNKLPQVITALTDKITECGGDILYSTKLISAEYDSSGFKSAEVKNLVSGAIYKIAAKAMILATGHSARDIFYMLHEQNILIEAKPFALGVRIEHPQLLIDRLQYHCEKRNDFLPPASYALAHNINGRGIYSFCMCPGGIIAPAATNHNEVVVNGWSPSMRNNKYANSGMVVSVEEDDTKPYTNVSELRYLEFQKKSEQVAFKAGGSNLSAPAQRMTDFADGKVSQSLPPSSYIPGIVSVSLDEVLPIAISSALKTALKHFGKKMPGYFTSEAVLVGIESRTSSPVRIPRNSETLMHPQIKGLFPCGEGAGYAGGIVSAAIDGDRCADAAVLFLNSFKL